MKWINVEQQVTVTIYDEEHEEHIDKVMTVEEMLDTYTNEGCPTIYSNPEPRFSRITVHTNERWLNRKLDTFKDRLYLNEKTMIIYVPFVSVELVEQSGTIKRIGEEE